MSDNPETTGDTAAIVKACKTRKVRGDVGWLVAAALSIVPVALAAVLVYVDYHRVDYVLLLVSLFGSGTLCLAAIHHQYMRRLYIENHFTRHRLRTLTEDLAAVVSPALAEAREEGRADGFVAGAAASNSRHDGNVRPLRHPETS